MGERGDREEDTGGIVPLISMRAVKSSRAGHGREFDCINIGLYRIIRASRVL